MCGRYTLTSLSLRHFEHVFNSSFDPVPARYNIAPGQDNPVIFTSKFGRALGHFRWGLVPHWSKEPRTKYWTINAKVETVAEKPFYHDAFKTRRCLVPADGWYEWQKTQDGKQPYRIHQNNQPFAFAGLWEYWEGEGAEPFHSYTILTGPAADSVKAIHARMPLVLPEDAWKTWMAPDTPPTKLTELLNVPETDFDCYPVSRRVNNPKNEGPELFTQFPQENS